MFAYPRLPQEAAQTLVAIFCFAYTDYILIFVLLQPNSNKIMFRDSRKLEVQLGRDREGERKIENILWNSAYAALDSQVDAGV